MSSRPTFEKRHISLFKKLWGKNYHPSMLEFAEGEQLMVGMKPKSKFLNK